MTTDPSLPGAIRFLPGPEPLGVLVAAVIVFAVLISSGSRAGSPGSSPTPTARPTAVVTQAPTVEPPADLAIADLLRVVNQRLLQQGEALAAELARETLRTEETAAIIGELRATVRLGADAAARLPEDIGEPGLGARLDALYMRLDEGASTALDAGGGNPVAYRTGGAIIIEALAALPALQAELGGPGGGSAGPATSVSPSSSAGAALGAEQLRNGGFEDGVGAPWSLVLAAAADASLNRETELAAVGSSAARIEIATETTARSAVSLRQAGLELVAGRRYVVAMWLRSTANREVRFRVASTAADVYASQIAVVTPLWTAQSWVFTAPASDDAAVLEIDVGRSASTVWIDAVSFAAESGEAPAP